MKKYLYRIFPETHLIIKYCKGPYTIEDLKQAANETARDPAYNPSMNVLNDFRQMDLDMVESEMEAFERYLESQKNMIGIRKSAFLTENPKQTVFSIMLETYKQNEDISIRTFSTLSAAISWLGIQNKQSEIENCLNHFINA